MAKDIQTELSRTIIALLIDEPFFAHLLSGMNREVSSKTKTIAIQIELTGPRLLINEAYFLQKLSTQKQRIAVLKHEVLHIAFGHFLRRRPDYIPELYDIAADLVVNQYIELKYLPKEAITLDSFTGLALESADTLENYYAILLKLTQSVPTSSRKDEVNQSFGSTIRQSAGELTETAQANGGDHQFWGEADNATKHAAENHLIRARARTPVASWGTIPSAIARLIAQLIDKRSPQVDWRRQLRLFGSSSQRTCIAHTMKRVSKRYGTHPGIRIRRFHNLLVALDTSGSVDGETVEKLFRELRGMWKTGSQITVVECDCEIGRVYSYNGSTPKVISGGGGTSFDPVFAFASARHQKRFDGLVYLTDGHADQPSICPPCRVLWVITSEGTNDNIRFGHSIRLKE